MQLVNMDVDPYGAQPRSHFGPLSPGLNAICGPRGSGKTTLLNWLRQIAAENQSPAPYPSTWSSPVAPLTGSSGQPLVSGRVELRNRGVTFQLASDRDGRVNYGASVHGSPAYGDRSTAWSVPTQALSARQRDAFQSLAHDSGAADTEASLEALARRLRLTDPQPTEAYERRQQLLAREQVLVQSLGRLPLAGAGRDALLAEQREVEAELYRLSQVRPTSDFVSDTRRLGERFELIEAELHNRQEELAQLDREIATVRGEIARCEVGSHTPEIGESFRSQLQQLDDRLNRWRQTLRDLKAHRERVDHNATDARLDKQIGDQLGSTKESDPRAALRSLEAQILNTRAQLDQLVDRYDTAPQSLTRESGYATPALGFDVRRDLTGRTRIAYGESYTTAPDAGLLPEKLRAMQHDLHEVCQQLARHEATAAAATLKQQAQQLQRCEAELLLSVERLIDERAALLRKIADEQHLSMEQLTLSFGQWCQCHDHIGLQDWLLREDQAATLSSQSTAPSKPYLLDDLQRLENQRKQVSLRCEECRRQLRDNDMVRRSHATQPWELRVDRDRARHDQLVRELERVSGQLQALQAREQSQSELERVRQELARLPLAPVANDRYMSAFNRHVAGLVGPHNRHYLPRAATPSAVADARYYDNINGTVATQPVAYAEYEVPSAVVRVALRLSIAEAMAAQGEPVALILDAALDGLSADVQRAAVAYLAVVARGQQQIILLTSDEQVANLVRAQHGYVGYFPAAIAPQIEFDINRQLTAYANDHEAAKWSHPIEREPIAPVRAPRSDYYLNDRSLIEDLPTLDATTAARCRALGIDRIGDLLDVDPHWLADNLRLDGISSAHITRWQAEARLLCSVRKLRPFDARVLVGAGIRTPQQLSEMHPSHLLDRVERFLSTEHGRNILRSGSSFELTRITSWIAAAKTGPQRYQRTSMINNELGYDEVEFPEDETAGFVDDNDDRERGYAVRDRNSAYVRNGTRADPRNGERQRTRSNNGARRTNPRNADRNATAQSTDTEYPALRREQRSEQRSGQRNEQRSERTDGARSRSEGTARGPRVSRSENRQFERAPRAPRTEPVRREAVRGETVRLAATHDSVQATQRLKFYLELASPVVDAPSIGPRMASRLEAFGILTVDQLLAAHAESLADKLNMRRIDADLIRGWQEQARLVCRIPNLRGHDAQLLVACQLTSPEELARMDASAVLEQVLEIAHSSEGQRILRGSQAPDLAEVNNWIAWAASCRSLHAA